MKGYKEIKKEYGFLIGFRLLLYPITLVFTNLVSLLLSIIYSLKLLRGDWKHYPHFNLLSATNSMFYSTRALNLKWFGRSGTSPYLGLGNYSLSRCFHYTLFSLNAYWKAGAVTVLIGMISWLLTHVLWIRLVDVNWLIFVLLATLLSTTFYANTFRQQNYNVVGWGFFPLFLFFLFQGHWFGAIISLLFVSFGSFTLVVISAFYAFAFCLYHWSILPILVILPAAIKLSTSFLPVFKSGKASTILKNVLKAIGASTQKAKYVRKAEKKMNLKFLYFLVIYMQFLLLSYWLSNEVPIFLFVAIIVYLINSLVARFADEQTVYMLMLTSAVPELMIRENYVLLASFWIAASPLPGFIGFDVFKKSIDRVVPLKPFNIKPYLDAFDAFFVEVNENERVLFAWNDPKDQYEKVFDGYRRIYEVALYSATRRKIHLTPDWWSVFELNYEGAPDFWGTSIPEVKDKMEEWKAHYVVIYQEDNRVLDPEWNAAGFSEVSKFEWEQFSEDFERYDKISVKGLTWWLLAFKT